MPPRRMPKRPWSEDEKNGPGNNFGLLEIAVLDFDRQNFGKGTAVTLYR